MRLILSGKACVIFYSAIYFRMQAIKQKLQGIYEFSKNALGQNSPKWRKLMTTVLSGGESEEERRNFKTLAEFSLDQQHYTQMCDALLEELEKFNYEAKTLKRTERSINLALFLVKHGSLQFAIDFERNADLFRKLGGINARHFENKLSMDIKKLNHSLEVIRHRAVYITQLISDKEMLGREREQAEKELPLGASEMASYEEGTACNFKVPASAKVARNSSFSQKSANFLANSHPEVAKEVPVLKPKQSNEPFRK